MDTKQLRAFLTTAELKNFTAAAQALYISQPALSYQILSLEEEIGAKLIDRSGRKVKLTDAGISFCDGARELLEKWDEICNQARETNNQNTTTVLKLGYLDSYLHFEIYDLLEKFKKENPRSMIVLNNTDFSALNHDTLNNNSFDAIFTHHIKDWPKDICTMTLREDQAVVITTQQYLEQIGLDTSNDYKDILSTNNLTIQVLGGFQLGLVGINETISSYTKKIYMEPQKNYLNILHKVALGKGIAILPLPVAQMIDPPTLLFFPITEEGKNTIRYSLIWHNNNKSDILKKFIDYISE